MRCVYWPLFCSQDRMKKGTVTRKRFVGQKVPGRDKAVCLGWVGGVWGGWGGLLAPPKILVNNHK